MVLAYGEDGRIIATLDGIFSDGEAVDLADHEASGGKLRQWWEVSGAIGSGTWPEQLGGEAHQYRVELDPSQPHRIVALIHRETGVRRER